MKVRSDLNRPSELEALPEWIIKRLTEVLMDELAGVDIDQLHDEYAAALEQLVDAKAVGEALTPTLEPTPVVDLMTSWEESARAARHARDDDEQESGHPHQEGD